MQKYEQLCAYVQSSEKNTGGDGYVNVNVRPSHINFAMYVKQTEKQQQALKMEQPRACARTPNFCGGNCF